MAVTYQWVTIRLVKFGFFFYGFASKQKTEWFEFFHFSLQAANWREGEGYIEMGRERESERKGYGAGEYGWRVWCHV